MSEEDIREVLDSIVADPQKNFPRFLFESDALDTVDLLNELVVLQPSAMSKQGGANGHTLALECLWCWQDLQESALGLSPIVDELQQTECVKVAAACLKLLVRLLKMAPNPVSRIRICREMDELQVDEIVPKLRDKFDWNLELNGWIAEWMSVRRASSTDGRGQSPSPPLAIHVSTGSSSSIAAAVATSNFKNDTDSGTFSGEEDGDTATTGIGATSMISSSASADNANDGGQQPDSLMDIIACLRSDQFKNSLDSFCQTLLEVLKDVGERSSTSNSQPSVLLQQIRDSLRASNNNNSEKVFLSTPKAPPPPPPCIIRLGGAPPKISGPTAPVPPPPINRSTTGLLLKSVATTGSTPNVLPVNVEIPSALKPKIHPAEGRKMRHLQWTKIPLNALVPALGNGEKEVGDRNVWQKMSRVDVTFKDQLDFSDLDQHFCACEPSLPSSSTSISNSQNSQLPQSSTPKQLTISLISGKRNLSVNIFLKMCKEVDKLLENLRQGHSELVGLDRLKMLLQLLPNEEEQKTLRHYTGDSSALGQAERFLLELIQIADYRFRIEAMTFRQEFDALMTDIEPDLQTLLAACAELKSSECLKKILYVLLHMGNYLNHGAVLGNAVGFKLNSLWKINDVKATKGTGRTLLHFIAQQVNNCSDELEKELPHIPDAAKLSFETLQSDVNGLQQRTLQLEKCSTKTNKDAFFGEFDKFIKTSKIRLSNSTNLLKEIERQRRELAVYFCENEKIFSMEECFKIFHAFMNRFKVASHENCQRVESAARRMEVTATFVKKDYPSKPDSLSKLLLGSDPYTPSAKRPRHSISTPQQCTVNSNSPMGQQRRSVVVLEQDRDRQLRMGTSQTTRRRSAQATRAENANGRGNDVSLFKSSIQEESENTEKVSPAAVAAMNSLESFMDKALETSQITRFPSRTTEPITTITSSSKINLTENPKKSNSKTVEEETLSPAVNKPKIDNTILAAPDSPASTCSLDKPAKGSDDAPDGRPIVRSGAFSRKAPLSSEKSLEKERKIKLNGLSRKSSFLQGVRTTQSSSGVEFPTSVESKPSTIVQLKPSALRASQKSFANSNVAPITPSQVKAAQKKSLTALSPPSSPVGIKHPLLQSTGRNPSLSSSSRTNSLNSTEKSAKKMTPSPLLRVATRNSQIKNKEEQLEVIQRINNIEKPLSRASITPTSTNQPVRKMVAEMRKSTPLTATEKRQAMMTPSNSVLSTSSRPALIKTGSMTENKPKRWI